MIPLASQQSELVLALPLCSASPDVGVRAETEAAAFQTQQTQQRAPTVDHSQTPPSGRPHALEDIGQAGIRKHNPTLQPTGSCGTLALTDRRQHIAPFHNCHEPLTLDKERRVHVCIFEEAADVANGDRCAQRLWFADHRIGHAGWRRNHGGRRGVSGRVPARDLRRRRGLREGLQGRVSRERATACQSESHQPLRRVGGQPDRARAGAEKRQS
jgi:hypothetical protein